MPPAAAADGVRVGGGRPRGWAGQYCEEEEEEMEEEASPPEEEEVEEEEGEGL